MARILVVDDDEQICDLVSRLLTNDGHEVSVAWTGLHAISMLREHAYDLMLLDLVMPEKGGIETIMELRGMAPDLPIIIMSGRISPGDASVRRLVEHYGAQAVLSKPFTSEELRNAVATVIT